MTDFEQINKNLKQSWQKIIQEHLDNGIPITYLKDDWIVKHHPDGTIEKNKILSKRLHNSQKTTL